MGRKNGKNLLKIAMLGHKRLPSREGGVEVVVEELSTRMVEKGHTVTCYNRRGHNVAGLQYDMQTSKEYKGVRCVDVLTINRKGLAAMSSSFFAAICTAFGSYDVVHFHAEGPAFMCWLPKLMRKKVIVTIHGLDWARAKWGRFASWYIKSGEKNAVRFADEVIVLSKGMREYFQKKYGRGTVFIPNGVTKPECQTAVEIKEKWGLDKDSYILFLGRIVPEKGEQYLIEAFKRVETEKKLVIAGGASDTHEFMMELQKKAKGDSRIVFTDFVQGKTLEELYSNAYFYCLPSDLEGMPLSLLEAMSYGNCCLVSDIPECAEVVEDNGVKFSKGDIDDLQKKIEMLCNNPDMVYSYRTRATEYIINKYSWDRVVDETVELYLR